MDGANVDSARAFRVWIVRYHDWQPEAWDQVPPTATAVRPVDGLWRSARQAADLAEGFNRVMLERLDRFWAVVIPIMVRYADDLQPGQSIGSRSNDPTPASHENMPHCFLQEPVKLPNR